MTSHDEDRRYEEINELHAASLSAMNLFAADPSGMSSLSLPSDSRVIAFDLPVACLAKLSAGNVSAPAPLSMEVLDPGWEFIGFDIVDPYTQTSALGGFGEGARRIVAGEVPLAVNGFGLVDDFAQASQAAVQCDALLPEHAPFVPAGVWLKGRHGSQA